MRNATHELEVINQMGYPGYFLIVWDFIDYANAKASLSVRVSPLLAVW